MYFQHRHVDSATVRIYFDTFPIGSLLCVRLWGFTAWLLVISPQPRSPEVLSHGVLDYAWLLHWVARRNPGSRPKIVKEKQRLWEARLGQQTLQATWAARWIQEDAARKRTVLSNWFHRPLVQSLHIDKRQRKSSRWQTCCKVVYVVLKERENKASRVYAFAMCDCMCIAAWSAWFWTRNVVLQLPVVTASGGGGSFKNRTPIVVVSHGWQSKDTDGSTGVSGLLSFSLVLVLPLTIYLPTYLSIYLFIYLPIYLSILSFVLSIYLSTYLSIYLSFFLSFYLSIYLPIYLSIYLSFVLFIYLSIYLPIYLSFFLSFYLSIYLSTYLSIYLSFFRSIYLSTI